MLPAACCLPCTINHKSPLLEQRPVPMSVAVAVTSKVRSSGHIKQTEHEMIPRPLQRTFCCRDYREGQRDPFRGQQPPDHRIDRRFGLFRQGYEVALEPTALDHPAVQAAQLDQRVALRGGAQRSGKGPSVRVLPRALDGGHPHRLRVLQEAQVGTHIHNTDLRELLAAQVPVKSPVDRSKRRFPGVGTSKSR